VFCKKRRAKICVAFILSFRNSEFWQTPWLSPDRFFAHLYQVWCDFLLQSHPSIAHLMAIAKRALLWIQIDSFKHNWQGTHKTSQLKKQLGPDFADVLCCIKNIISPRLGLQFIIESLYKMESNKIKSIGKKPDGKPFHFSQLWMSLQKKTHVF
jgi:hypothetical protein